MATKQRQVRSGHHRKQDSAKYSGRRQAAADLLITSVMAGFVRPSHSGRRLAFLIAMRGPIPRTMAERLHTWLLYLHSRISRNGSAPSLWLTASILLWATAKRSESSARMAPARQHCSALLPARLRPIQAECCSRVRILLGIPLNSVAAGAWH